MSETDVVITIKNDQIPELEEELTVTLTAVEPLVTQRLKLGASTRKLVIRENDNPGGIFEFTVGRDTYTLEVSLTGF